jgi:hypothetical protein
MPESRLRIAQRRHGAFEQHFSLVPTHQDFILTSRFFKQQSIHNYIRQDLVLLVQILLPILESPISAIKLTRPGITISRRNS